MDKGTTAVVRKIQGNIDDLEEYDDLVNEWSHLCEKAWKESASDVHFADVEKAAIAALSDEPPERKSGEIGNEVSQMLNSFPYPTYLVTAEGLVAASNVSAWKEFSLEVGEKIDLLPLLLSGSKKISGLIRDELKSTESDNESNMVLRRTHSVEEHDEATVAISTSIGRVTTALVFVITNKWKPRSVELIKRQFGLTDAEADILMSFVDGYSTQNIAQQRHRSHETVKAQFQSIRQKIGAKNQIELLRTALSVSDFSINIGAITNAVEHPHRRRAVILRKGGRRVELTMMGDFSGDPVLTLANITHYTFNAEIEQAFFDRQMCLISVCTPGCGQTDLTPSEMNRIDCIVEDIDAVLTQLVIEKCLMLAYNSNSALCYPVLNSMPNRFFHLAHVSAPVPIRYYRANTQSSWTNGILRACTSHPAMKRVLLKGAIKAMVTIGIEKFLRMQLSSQPLESKILFHSVNLREAEYTLTVTTQSGVTPATEDLAYTFEDWSHEVDRLPVKITLLQGKQNSLYLTEYAQRFTEDYPEKIEMIEIDEAGFPLLQTYPAHVVDHLKDMIHKYGC